MQSLLDLSIEQAVDHNNHKKSNNSEPNNLGAHQILHGVGGLFGGFYLLQTNEKLIMLFLKESHLPINILVVRLIRQDFQLH